MYLVLVLVKRFWTMWTSQRLVRVFLWTLVPFLSEFQSKIRLLCDSDQTPERERVSSVEQVPDSKQS